MNYFSVRSARKNSEKKLTMSQVQVVKLLNSYAIVNRIQKSQNRRQFRQPKELDQDVAR